MKQISLISMLCAVWIMALIHSKFYPCHSLKSDLSHILILAIVGVAQTLMTFAVIG